MRLTFLIWLPVALVMGEPAWGQVSTDDHALESLQPAPKAPAPAHPAAPVHRRGHTAAVAHTTRPVAARLPALQVPPAPPAYPVIAPPPLALPTHAKPVPPAVPLKPNAVGTVTPIANGTRLTFGPGVADLNPTTLAALQAIAADAAANPAMIVVITAWAPGTADDPSTPRRLSLDRGLAARAVLIRAGIVSERIRTIAKGMIDIGTDAPDRLDIVKQLPVTTGAPPPSPAPVSPKPK